MSDWSDWLYWSDSDEFGSNKISMILLLVFVIMLYIVLFSVLHANETPSGPVLVIEIILWIVLIIIVIVNIKWLYDIDLNINVDVDNLFDDEPTGINIFARDKDDKDDKDKKDKKDKKEKEKDKKDTNYQGISGEYAGISGEKTQPCPAPTKCKSESIDDNDGEVFHIESNTYTYDDAKSACKLFKSRLATYEEVERAYQNGANWCSYGWSDEQLALFPIQKSLYNQLKTIKGHQNDCGRQGVNGGYIEDSKTKFGVNCYGKKPYMTDKDAAFMKNYTYTPTISAEEQSKLDNKVNDILIAPFSKDRWSFQ
jgi:hypothetical protein